jgi:hypothetical protein
MDIASPVGKFLESGVHRGGEIREVQAAQDRGLEFLLVHRLFRSHRTGEIIKPVFTRFSFPPRWHYDILRALDCFQAVNARCDTRLAEAIDILLRSRRPDGCWLLQNSYPGKTYFEVEHAARRVAGILCARCAC